MTDVSGGLESSSEEIASIAQNCKYDNCSHTTEDGCAVLTALEEGDLNSESYENYLKMEKERMHFESNAQERKKKDKALGKLVKNMKRGRDKY